MRRLLAAALSLTVAARAAQAQVMPNINKPIQAAKNAAASTNAQTNAAQRVGEGSTSQPGSAPQKRPAEAAQAATPPKSAAATAPAPTAAQAAAPAGKGAPATASASQSGGKAQMTFYRESFAYAANGRRDPFLSLMATGEIRPLLVDLTLIGVLYNQATPTSSVAVLVDGSSGETYRVKMGNILGRMKVVRIGREDVTLNIDEFGFSRQETIVVNRTPRTTGGQPGRRP
jgi:hypothetical protein